MGNFVLNFFHFTIISRYILWTEENVPKGCCQIGTLLESCIKEFHDVSRYQNDERYLDVWLKYVSCLELMAKNMMQNEYRLLHCWRVTIFIYEC